jgi:hypothetical protein
LRAEDGGILSAVNATGFNQQLRARLVAAVTEAGSLYLYTMTTKHELATLRELRRVYQNCPERVATYVRWRWISRAIAWVLIFVASLLTSSESVSPLLCLPIAVLGGLALGLGILFSTSAKQMPLFVRYATLRDEDIQKRLQELGDA